MKQNKKKGRKNLWPCRY